MPSTDLPIAGRVVNEVAWTSGGLWLRFWFPRTEYGLHIEGEFRVVTGGVARHNDPRTPHESWFGLCNRTIRTAEAADDGALTIRFMDGGELLIAPGRYEPWRLEGEDGELFVSVAGGGLAIWERQTPKG
jgi:hypothetical protein